MLELLIFLLLQLSPQDHELPYLLYINGELQSDYVTRIVSDPHYRTVDIFLDKIFSNGFESGGGL